MPKTYSIAISPCPNDIYIFGGIILGQIKCLDFNLKFEFHDIQRLNTLAQSQSTDIIKVSAAVLNQITSYYQVLPAGGAMGRGVGPLVLTNQCELDPSHTIMVPGQTTTAHFLLSRFLNNPKHKSFLPFDKLYQTLCQTPGSQGVVIHENRFTYAQDGLTLGLDLGEKWHQETGLPLPLGVIVSKVKLGLSQPLSHLIQDSITWAQNNPKVILDLCRKYSQSMRNDVMQSHIDIYVNEFSYNMGDEGKKALDALLELSAT